MEYKIYVEKREKNEKYAEEYKDWQGRMNYGYSPPAPQEFIIDRVLEVVLTDEEFKRAKTEIIKNFE